MSLQVRSDVSIFSSIFFITMNPGQPPSPKPMSFNAIFVRIGFILRYVSEPDISHCFPLGEHTIFAAHPRRTYQVVLELAAVYYALGTHFCSLLLPSLRLRILPLESRPGVRHIRGGFAC